MNCRPEPCCLLAAMACMGLTASHARSMKTTNAHVIIDTVPGSSVPVVAGSDAAATMDACVDIVR
jgi:hypothetical protein